MTLEELKQAYIAAIRKSEANCFTDSDDYRAAVNLRYQLKTRGRITTRVISTL